MNLSPDYLIKLLIANGFYLKRSKGSHKIYFRESDKTTITLPYHKGKDMPKGTFLSILKKAGININ